MQLGRSTPLVEGSQGAKRCGARVTFLVHRGKHYTVEKFLRTWGRSLRNRVQVKTYPGLRLSRGSFEQILKQTFGSWRVGHLRASSRLPRRESSAGREVTASQVYVFCDHERLRPDELERTKSLWSQLDAESEVRLLNHPSLVLPRFELLDRLHGRGQNQFAVYPLEANEIRSWPVFIRPRAGHGIIGTLLDDRSQFEIARRQLLGSGQDPKRFMVVEFSDTSDEDGLFRKYGAFRLGDHVIARHLHFSRNWLLREPDLRTAVTAEEELRYVESNPHADLLKRVFDLARVEYGRIDYSCLEGKVQIWEINTNPMILVAGDRKDARRRAAHDVFWKRLRLAFGELLEGGDQSSRNG